MNNNTLCAVRRRAGIKWGRCKKLECRVTAVLVAAGSSTRMGFDKLSFDLGGETVLERSVRAFDECPEVDELVIVTGASGENAQRAAARCKKPVRLVKGGSTRAESARSGVAAANMLLTTVKEAASPYTIVLANNNPSAVLPSLGLGALFNKNQYVGLAIPLSIVMAILIWIVLDKTRFGYELKATGFNRNAAKYCGMAEKRNVILSLVISGALAGMGAALLYLTGYEQWQCSTSSVPAMGFNGIAAAFLGGLNPLGTVLASFFIQHITAGGAYVDKSLYCAQISDLISSIIIYLCGFVLFMKHVMNSSIAKREEKAALKAKAAAEQDAANGKGGDQA